MLLLARSSFLGSLRQTRRPVKFLLLLSLLPSAARSLSSSFYQNSMSTFVTERTGDGTITVSPKNEGDQSALIVIAHGLGDSAEGFADVAEHLASKMPHAKFILPTAPTQPVTMNMGMAMPSWYDIVGLDERSNENCKGIEESQARLAGILQKEHEATGLPYARMVLAGFSQGGALSLYTGMQLPEKIAAVICMSGYLPHASAFKVTQPSTPVWHGHGTQDGVVAFALAAKSRDMVLSKGAETYTIKKYPIAHTVSTEEIADVYAFLQTVLADDATCKIQLKDPAEMSVKELKAAIRKAGLAQQALGFMEKPEFVKLLQDHRSK